MGLRLTSYQVHFIDHFKSEETRPANLLRCVGTEVGCNRLLHVWATPVRIELALKLTFIFLSCGNLLYSNELLRVVLVDRVNSLL